MVADSVGLDVGTWAVGLGSMSVHLGSSCGHQAQSIAKINFLIAFLKEQGDKALSQAEMGADPLVKMRDEVDRLLETMSAIEAEVVQLQNERVRSSCFVCPSCAPVLVAHRRDRHSGVPS